MKILIIEDEPKLIQFLKKGLLQQGHAVDTSMHGSEGLEMATVNDYDLLLLDLMLPGQNGFDILKNLRDFNINTPVIILTAVGDTEHVVKGLDLGAMDYIKKPFDFEELMARIRAVQRKSTKQTYTKLQLEDLEMDLLSREVHRANQKLELTKREFSLLELLLRNANRVVSKQEIAEKVWDVNFDMGSNVIEVHMYQLRKKVDKNRERKLLETLIGVGYTVRGNLIKS